MRCENRSAAFFLAVVVKKKYISKRQQNRFIEFQGGTFMEEKNGSKKQKQQKDQHFLYCWDEVEREIFTEEEIAASRKRVALLEKKMCKR